MNLSTIVYLGEQEQGNGRTLRLLLQNMEDGDNPSWWACYIFRAINLERISGQVTVPDETQAIIERMEAIMRTKAGAKEVYVGSVNSQQAGLVCPTYLVNYIFDKRVNLKRMWEWIRAHFLPIHRYGYDWFALLRFLADNQMLEKGMNTSNPDFAKQMTEWFPSYDCTDNNVKIYRTGYLGATPYKQWVKARFTNVQRSNQKVEGFNHLDRICNCELSLACQEDDLTLLFVND